MEPTPQRLTPRKKEYVGLDKYTWIRRSRRTYRKNKPKFFLCVGVGVLFVSATWMGLNQLRYNNQNTNEGNDQQQQQNAAENANKVQKGPRSSYVDIKNLEPTPLTIRPDALRPPTLEDIQQQQKQREAAANTPNTANNTANDSANTATAGGNNAPNSASPSNPNNSLIPKNTRPEKIYAIDAPSIDKLTLGQDMSDEKLTSLGYELDTKRAKGFTLAIRKNSSYTLYGQTKATLALETVNGKITKMMFNFPAADTAKMTQSVLKAHDIEPSALTCFPTKVLNLEKMKNEKIQEFSDAKVCSLNAKGPKVSINMTTIEGTGQAMVVYRFNDN